MKRGLRLGDDATLKDWWLVFVREFGHFVFLTWLCLWLAPWLIAPERVYCWGVTFAILLFCRAISGGESEARSVVKGLKGLFRWRT